MQSSNAKAVDPRPAPGSKPAFPPLGPSPFERRAWPLDLDEEAWFPEPRPVGGEGEPEPQELLPYREPGDLRLGDMIYVAGVRPRFPSLVALFALLRALTTTTTGAVPRRYFP